MEKKTPDIKKVHTCKESEGKIVNISVDPDGSTRCGYCKQKVDYSPLWENQEFNIMKNKAVKKKYQRLPRTEKERKQGRNKARIHGLLKKYGNK